MYDVRHGLMEKGRVGVDGSFIVVGGVRVAGCSCW